MFSIFRKIFFIGFLISVDAVFARAPSLLWQNGAIYSAESFTDFTGLSNRPDDTSIFIKNIYQMGYFFSDASLRGMGQDQWQVRARAREIGNLKNGNNRADVRHVFIENKSPIADHLYVSAGRMFSPFFLPMQRMDGGVLRFTPTKRSPWQIGLEGGQIPAESSAFLTQNLPRNHAGSFLTFDDEKGNNFKVHYDTGFEYGKTQIHKGELTGGKNFKFDDWSWFTRGAIQFTMPYSVLDYAQAETGVTFSETQTHSLSAMNAETLFVLSQSQTELQKFSEYRYNYTWHDPNSQLRVMFSLGPSVSAGSLGYMGMGRLMFRRPFLAFDRIETNLTSRQRNIYRQNQAIIAYSINPWSFLGFRIYAGGELVTFRDINTSNLQYGLALSGDGFDTLNYNVSLEIRHYLFGMMEVRVEASLFHVLDVSFGKNQSSDVIGGSL